MEDLLRGSMPVDDAPQGDGRTMHTIKPAYSPRQERKIAWEVVVGFTLFLFAIMAVMYFV